MKMTRIVGAAGAVFGMWFASNVDAQEPGRPFGRPLAGRPVVESPVLPGSPRPEWRPEYRHASVAPAPRPDFRPEYRPEYRPDFRPEHRPDFRPEFGRVPSRGYELEIRAHLLNREAQSLLDAQRDLAEALAFGDLRNVERAARRADALLERIDAPAGLSRWVWQAEIRRADAAAREVFRQADDRRLPSARRAAAELDERLSDLLGRWFPADAVNGVLIAEQRLEAMLARPDCRAAAVDEYATHLGHLLDALPEPVGCRDTVGFRRMLASVRAVDERIIRAARDGDLRSARAALDRFEAEFAAFARAQYPMWVR